MTSLVRAVQSTKERTFCVSAGKFSGIVLSLMGFYFGRSSGGRRRVGRVLGMVDVSGAAAPFSVRSKDAGGCLGDGLVPTAFPSRVFRFRVSCSGGRGE